jgi:segregation and condensation protein B
VTYVVTEGFLDHFGLETPRDLPGLKELREAGLLDNRPPPGAFQISGSDEEDEDVLDPIEGQEDMFGP